MVFPSRVSKLEGLMGRFVRWSDSGPGGEHGIGADSGTRPPLQSSGRDRPIDDSLYPPVFILSNCVFLSF